MLQIKDTDKNIFRHDHLLKYDPEMDCIVMEIFGYINSSAFRELTEELLRLIKHYKVKKILADTTYMIIIGATDQHWFIENWFPRAIKAGFTACAMINSRHFFNRIAIQNISREIDKKLFTLELFDHKEDALRWLKEMA